MLDSPRFNCLWGKASVDKEMRYTPLAIHLLDTGAVSLGLWDSWITKNIKKRLCSGIRTIEGTAVDEDEVRQIVLVMSLLHDIGKATPAFQGKKLDKNPGLQELLRQQIISQGFEMRMLNDPTAIPHGTASEIFLENMGVPRCLAVVAGGHHGIPPNRHALSRRIHLAYEANLGTGHWAEIRNEMVDSLMTSVGTSLEFLKDKTADPESQAILTSIVVTADWISSNENLFPLYIENGVPPTGWSERMNRGLQKSRFPPVWTPHAPCGSQEVLFRCRFGFEPRPFQNSVVDLAGRMKAPGLMIIEAPMGEGKTEAALAAAEILAERFDMGGLMIALPTQATSDGLFCRVSKWIDSVSASQSSAVTVFLAHGKSRFNTDYTSLDRVSFGSDTDRSGGIVHSWFTGKHKGILSDFVIGTVDQVLMAGLKRRHLEMRHLGLASKVVVIDECHAYDAYMGSYLDKALEWLGSYGTPVILLSATLPPERKKELISAYSNEKTDSMHLTDAYPCLTSYDGSLIELHPESSGRRSDVGIVKICDTEIVDVIKQHAGNGGYFGVILNTVCRAQRFARMISAEFPDTDVRLLHSGFTSLDRSIRESDVISELGPNGRRDPPFTMIVVGTQVMEQSMDLDFDLLITDICPMDLLIQRIGRLHRHKNRRPTGLENPVCYVIDTQEPELERGSELVYGAYQLYNTRLLLASNIRIPEDVPGLINAAYSVDGLNVPEQMEEAYGKARREMDRVRKDKMRRANAFQVSSPHRVKELTGWLDNSAKDDTSGIKAAATVRDGDGSVDAILVIRTSGGEFRMLPWVSDCNELPLESPPSADAAFTLAGCKAPIPRRVINRLGLDHTVDKLSAMTKDLVPPAWSQSEWLNGELYLVLDECYRASIENMTIQYDRELGMMMVD